jgi:hypothetical protein
MKQVEVKLDSVVKARGQNEWRDVPRASALGVEVVGDGNIIVKLLTELVMAQKIGMSDIVHVFRGDVACFVPMKVEKWVLNNKGNWKVAQENV